MTLIEVMVAMLVMTVAVQILSSIMSASMSYTASKQERGLAVESAMNVLEEMHATPFYDVFATFNSIDTDDPRGAGTGHGAAFSVPGLDPIPGEAFVGRVLLPERNGVLLETLESAELGLPRDLNGDLLVDGLDHSDDYLLLPVLVIVRWQGRYGPRTLRLGTMLADLEKEEASR